MEKYYTHSVLWDVIIYTCSNFNGGLDKLKWDMGNWLPHPVLCRCDHYGRPKCNTGLVNLYLLIKGYTLDDKLVDVSFKKSRLVD